MLLAPDFLLLAALLQLRLPLGPLLLLSLAPLRRFSVAPPALILLALLLRHLPLPVGSLASPPVLLLALQLLLRGAAGRRRGHATATTGSTAAPRLQPEGRIRGAIPRDLPVAERRAVGSLVTVVGPDLVTPHLWAEPPAAEVGSVPLVPEVDQHADAARRAVLPVHGPPMVGALHRVGALDDVGHRLVGAARDREGSPRRAATSWHRPTARRHASGSRSHTRLASWRTSVGGWRRGGAAGRPRRVLAGHASAARARPGRGRRRCVALAARRGWASPGPAGVLAVPRHVPRAG
mmetsp:Transcript_64747/g.202783  ORF Transcript_64747/g.202783 Transcript_64747/m.202783 type:complete len:293 (-) Transcript_64747:63-941(-)